jgi:hypothetical protein
MTAPPSELTTGDWESLTAKINELAPYLTLSGTWYGDAVDANEDRLIRVLQEKSAIIKVEGHHTNEVRNKYQWKEGVKERLKEYYQSMDTLPCGHRSHIFNTEDGLSCKYCKQINDEEPIYTKETVKECL